MSDSFYNDEESKKLKKDCTAMLKNIDSLIIKFMNNYQKNPKLQNELNDIIYSSSLYNTRKKLSGFSQLVNKTGKIDREELKKKKEETEMFKKRKKEIDNVKDFVDTHYLKMLPDSKEDQILKLPSKEKEEIELEEPKKKEEELKEKPKEKSKNILFEPEPQPSSEKEKEQNSDEDIKIESVAPHKNNFLKKKRKEKEKQKDGTGKVFFNACYICKAKFTGDNFHQFYHNLCKKCGDFNYKWRTIKPDLKGRFAVVTGGRVKIGYYIATKLLSYGAKVIITSRFPKDTLLKYAEHEDYQKWKDNLLIYPIDFRLFESTVKFVKFINETFPHVDILINNAAQTIRRTTAYYKYLLPIETKTLSEEQEKKIVRNDYINLKDQLLIGEGKKESSTSLVSLAKSTEDKSILPLSVIASQIRIMEEKEQPTKTMIGSDGQTYDFSKGKNSWNLELDEVPFQEFTEVQIINAWTPYYLSVKLKDAMMRSPFPDRYIVNVTSVEGIFNHYKRTSHPHTNMAKAALNMMTRTCGAYYKQFGIYMTSVDTGWVSPMNEMNRLMDKGDKRAAYEEEFKNVPLDELDGAMRVLHPIIDGIVNKNYQYGILLKDYTKSPW